LKRCGLKLVQPLNANRCTPHGDLVAAGGMTLQSPDAHDLAFSFRGNCQ
jgi:hypothetical protein